MITLILLGIAGFLWVVLATPFNLLGAGVFVLAALASIGLK